MQTGPSLYRPKAEIAFHIGDPSCCIGGPVDGHAVQFSPATPIIDKFISRAPIRIPCRTRKACHSGRHGFSRGHAFGVLIFGQTPEPLVRQRRFEIACGRADLKSLLQQCRKIGTCLVAVVPIVATNGAQNWRRPGIVTKINDKADRRGDHDERDRGSRNKQSRSHCAPR